MTSPEQTSPEPINFDTIVTHAIAPTFEDIHQYRSIEASFTMRQELLTDYQGNASAYVQDLYETVSYSTTAALYSRTIHQLEPLCMEKPQAFMENIDIIDTGFVVGLELANRTIDTNYAMIFMTEAFKSELLPYLGDSQSTDTYRQLRQLGYNWHTYHQACANDLTTMQPVLDETYDPYHTPHDAIIDALTNHLAMTTPEQHTSFVAGFGLAMLLEEKASYMAWLSDNVQ